MDEDRVIGDGISLESVDNMVMDETGNCCMDNDVSDKDVQHQKSNGDYIHYPCLVMMTPLEEDTHMAANDIILNRVSTPTSNGTLLETSDDPCSRYVIPHVDSHGVPAGVSNVESTISQGSSDTDVLAMNLIREHHSESEELRSNVDEYNVGSSEESINKGQGLLSSDVPFGRHSPPHVGCAKLTFASDADGTLNQLGVASEAVSRCMDFEINEKILQIKKSQEDTNVKIHDPYLVSTAPLEENQHTAANGVGVSVVSSETGACIFLETSGNLHSRDVTQHMGSYGVSASVANDMSTASQSSCNSDVLAMNIERVPHNEAIHCSSVDKDSMGSSKEKVDEGPKESSHVGCGDPSTASDAADTSLTQLSVLNAVASESESRTVNITADGALSRSTRKKLLVLDVNGLLADICSYVPYFPEPDEILCKKAVFKRPFCNDFLNFCLERFNVGVWSSRTRRNMEPIIDFLVGNDKGKMLFHWDQSHCTYTGFNTIEKRHKPILVKKLKKLWDKYEPGLPWEKGDYNESNTLLIDDSPYKALYNPRYTAIFPHSYRFRHVADNSLGPGGDIRVYLERLAMAENVQEFVKENPFGQRAITEKNLSWGYYSKVIAAANTSPPHPPRENMFDQCAITQKNLSWGYRPRVTAAGNSYPPQQNAEVSSNPWGYHSRVTAAAYSYPPRQNAEVSSNPWGVARFWS